MRYFKEEKNGKMTQMGVINFHLYCADIKMAGNPAE
jgi:hypothetical protein